MSEIATLKQTVNSRILCLGIAFVMLANPIARAADNCQVKSQSERLRADKCPPLLSKQWLIRVQLG